MFETALDGLLAKSKKLPIEIDVVLGGDLLNQCVSTSFAMRKSSASFLGLYNACGTYAESMILGAALCGQVFGQCRLCKRKSFFKRRTTVPLSFGAWRSQVSHDAVDLHGRGMFAVEQRKNLKTLRGLFRLQWDGLSISE